ncbi:RNA-directed DNA polymerase (Reverse transcriptase), Ribonuclease H-like protein [Gossypium australe]|uniref:RNA-directed DNA polymerase n=1 Tax=Gossypium australe TaxID=47621 RepID=A0A5B6VVN8_9ROSI|nr:RNA-directed DNA polymerase (Reverse transcriptase), Ribonuclease H-like protein [Gossypium australe]
MLEAQRNMMAEMAQILNGAMDKGKGPILNAEDNEDFPRGFSPPHVQTQPEEYSRRPPVTIRPQQGQADTGVPMNFQVGIGSNPGDNPTNPVIPNLDIVEREGIRTESLRQLEDSCRWLKEKFKAFKNVDHHYGIDAKDLSLVPDLVLLHKFKMAEFEKYNGTSFPEAHITVFCRRMTGYVNNDQLLIQYFQDRLVGWHPGDMTPDRIMLQNMEKKSNESFRQYVQRWREVTMQVQPPLLEKETTMLFINNLKAPFITHMIRSTTKSFADIVMAGEMIENAIRGGKIEAGESIRRFAPRKKNNKVNNTSTYNKGYSKAVTVSQPKVVTTGQQGSTRQESGPRQNSKKLQFTPIPMAYKELYQSLFDARVVSSYYLYPLQPPYPKWYDSNAHCDYHAGISGHSIENYTAFKKVVERLIKMRIVKFDDTPSAENPLPNHGDKGINAIGERVVKKIKGVISEVKTPLRIVSKEMVRRGLIKSSLEEGGPGALINEPVKEEEAKEFLKFLKHSEYSVVEQLCKQPARISVLALLLSSDVHREPLMKVLNETYVTKDISRLSIDISHMKTCQNIVRAFDGSERKVMGRIDIPLQIGPNTYEVDFLVMDIKPSYNCLLGRPWIHSAGAVPSSLHQKLKLVTDGRLVTINAEEDIIATVANDTPYLEDHEDGPTNDGREGSLTRKRIGQTSAKGSSSAGIEQRNLFGIRPYELGSLLNNWTAEELPVVFRDYTKFVKNGKARGETDLTPGGGGREHSLRGRKNISGLSTNIVVHLLPIREKCKPIQQKLRRMMPNVMLKIKEEVQKQFDVGFLQVFKYLEWVANIVPVPKKDGKVRICMDYRDLNKTSPKDNFPLPHIDTLVDNTVGYSLFSFMDGFLGYNQIKMHPDDMRKTTFITLWGTFYYKVMPFGLKNAGATYQRAMVTLFHNMMHKEIEVYVDVMIAKSRTEKEHNEVLKKLFLRLRKFQLKLIPEKCTFGARSGKLLGFVVSERGIEVDSNKVKEIQELPPPHTQKEVRGFLARLNYITRFISQLTEKCDPIFRLLKKHNQGVWDNKCQRVFDKVKQYLSNAPVLSPPNPDRPLILYLSVFNNFMGCVLGQHDESGRKEKLIYYLSKKFTDCEMRYWSIEKLCCALIWTTRRLRQYMLYHTTWLISKLDPLKYMMESNALNGRMARWQTLLSEFDIVYVNQKAIKWSAVAEFLANRALEDYEPLNFDFSNEELMYVANTEDCPWKLKFDGAANAVGNGIGAILVTPSDDYYPFT